jgi:hypothetical protein
VAGDCSKQINLDRAAQIKPITDYPRRVHAEDFRGTGDVWEITEFNAAMIWVAADPPFRICGCIHRVDELMSGKD